MVYHGSLIDKPGKIPFRWPFRGWRYLATASGVIFLFWKTSLSETRRAGHAFSQWPWRKGTDWGRRYLPYVRPIFQAYVRGYTPKIWPYMGKYLQSIGSWRSPIDSLDRQIVVFVGVPQICGIRPSQHIPTIQWLGVVGVVGVFIFIIFPMK